MSRALTSAQFSRGEHLLIVEHGRTNPVVVLKPRGVTPMPEYIEVELASGGKRQVYEQELFVPSPALDAYLELQQSYLRARGKPGDPGRGHWQDQLKAAENRAFAAHPAGAAWLRKNGIKI